VTIAIVLPFYNESDGAAIFLNELKQALTNTRFKDSPLIIVNDGSIDDTLDRIQESIFDYQNARIINFYTNYGHEVAVRAGISKALEIPNVSGIAVMDTDFQDPIEVLIELLEIFSASQVATFGRSIERVDSVQKKLLAKLYYFIQGYMYGNQSFAQVRNFFVIPRDIASALVDGQAEYQSVRSNLIELVRRNALFHPFSRGKREYGNSKYPLRASFGLAINGILGQPRKINHWIGRSAISNLVFSLFLGIYIIWARWHSPETQNTGLPFALLLLTFLLFVLSLGFWILISLVIRIFQYSRSLPSYVIVEKREMCE
jgi:polyisoprenyl-phosphate glycosyltransferase